MGGRARDGGREREPSKISGDIRENGHDNICPATISLTTTLKGGYKYIFKPFGNINADCKTAPTHSFLPPIL